MRSSARNVEALDPEQRGVRDAGRHHRPAVSAETATLWSRAQRRLMFFGDGDPKTENLNVKTCPHPALVFIICGRELFVRALRENRRPKSNTRLLNAPYWSTDGQGRVCLGSMRVPDEVGASSLRGWEQAYFASEFTHLSGAVRLATHPAGFVGRRAWRTEIPSRKISGTVQADFRSSYNAQSKAKARTILRWSLSIDHTRNTCYT